MERYVPHEPQAVLVMPIPTLLALRNFVLDPQDCALPEDFVDQLNAVLNLAGQTAAGKRQSFTRDTDVDYVLWRDTFEPEGELKRMPTSIREALLARIARSVLFWTFDRYCNDCIYQAPSSMQKPRPNVN